MMKRDVPKRGEIIENHFWPREYRKVSSVYSSIRQLRFRVTDEDGKDFKGYTSMRLRLHFVSR